MGADNEQEWIDEKLTAFGVDYAPVRELLAEYRDLVTAPLEARVAALEGELKIKDESLDFADAEFDKMEAKKDKHILALQSKHRADKIETINKQLSESLTQEWDWPNDIIKSKP